MLAPNTFLIQISLEQLSTLKVARLNNKIKKAIGDKILKVIIETCYLTNEEKKIATKLVLSAGADFVKTSTGFGTAGATLEDVELLKSVTQNKIQIKASGGIRDFETAQKFIKVYCVRSLVPMLKKSTRGAI